MPEDEIKDAEGSAPAPEAEAAAETPPEESAGAEVPVEPTSGGVGSP